MVYNSLFPLRGKKCVIADVSLADAYIEVDPSFDRESAIKSFKEALSQNLRQYGIEVIDKGASLQHQDIILAIQFTVIIQNATSAQLLGFGFLNELEAMDLQGNPSASLSAGLSVGPIIEAKGKILTDGTELPEVSAKARLSSFFLFDGSIGLLHKCFARVAEMLSSQINAALINYYAGGAGPETAAAAGATQKATSAWPGIAERSLAGDSDWRPVLGICLIFLICAGAGIFFYHKAMYTRMAATQTGGSSTPLSAEDYVKKGLEAGDPTEKIFYFTKAIELKSDYAAAYNYRGVAHHRKGEYALSIQDFTKSIEIDPNLHNAYRNRGIDYYHQQDYEHALDDYNKAIDFNPSDGLSYYCRALLYKRTGNWDKARQDYDKAKSLNPQVPNIKLE